jgi:cysteine synthase A
MPEVVDNLCDLIGNTPMLSMKRFAEGLPGTIIGKLESFNPGSSVKDRIALSMIEQAEKDGHLREGGTIIEPTSGNTGIGLALVSAVKGYRIILVMPESMSIERRKILKGLGAELVLTESREGMSGAIARAEHLLKGIDGAFMPHQFKNPANPQAHIRTTAEEIWNSLDGTIDIFVAAVGTGGTVSGVGKYLKQKNSSIKVVAVEPVESPVLSGGAMGPHMIQGIGAGFIPDNYNSDVVDSIEKVSSQEAIEASREVAVKEGLLVGISAGANAAVAKRLAALPENRDKNIVTIMCDTGERYLSTVLFNDD